MKRNKLYTVTKGNIQPLVRSVSNTFDWGGLAQADKQKNPWDYADDMDTTQQYMNQKNWLGISKAENPFSRGNLSGGIKAMAGTPLGGSMIGALAGTVGNIGGSLISDGLSSGAGKAISSIGSTVGSAISTVNPLIGGIVSIGSGLLGGVTNALWGTKTNQERLNAANAGTAQLNNFTSNATDFSGIQAPEVVSNIQDPYRGGVFKKGWARRKNAALAEAREDAVDWANRSMDNNIDNISNNRLNNALANYSAFGGPIGPIDSVIDNDNMGAIEYGFMSDYLTQKRQAAEARNRIAGMNIFAGKPQNTLFAIGGDIQMNGGDFSTGLSHVDAGKSHEENPNGGVQMGTDREGVPNLVEEGEVIFNDYVYSNRIQCDEATKNKFHIGKKRELSYADLAKKLEKEIQERPNDPISRSGFQAQMQQLADEQERQKQEMEEERAKEAFEALSPEEKVAVMQGVSARENLAAQEQQQAIAEQQAAMQAAAAQQQPTVQPTPEEIAMAQQGQSMMADGSETALGQEPVMNRFGGKINRFDTGGQAYTRMLNSLGFHTQKEFEDWAAENKIDFQGLWDKTPGILNTEILGALWNNEAFKEALSKRNPALAHAFKEAGYDWGAYQPTANGNATIQSINRGNWKTTNGRGWRGSEDLAFRQATEGLSDAEIDALTTEQLAERMRNTTAYQNTNRWLQNSDNALQYLNTLLNDPNTPEVAKQYARKFVQDGRWKDGFNYDYATVFGSNGQGVRETNPGTYWHTVLEANRGNQAGNFVINTDGTVEPIIGDIPENWTPAGDYSWADNANNYVYNYYRRPSSGASDDIIPGIKRPVGVIPGDLSASQARMETDFEGLNKSKKNDNPRHRAEWLRYAGLFGPAAGLGMMAAGVGKPDYSRLDAAVAAGSGAPVTASYKPIGDYLTYNPLDVWSQQNALNAQARATDRAIQNQSSPSRMAGLLASGYNSQIASGNLFRQALEYNDALRRQVAEFNRGTNQYNADAYTRNSQFNADALNRNRQFNAQLQMEAARQRADADAGWYNSLYGNVAGLFRGLGDIGTENYRMNRISEMAADSLLGAIGNSNLGRRVVTNTKSNGGKMKKKRGLTY